MTSFKIMEDIGLDSIQDNETYNYESYKQTFTNLPYNSKEFQITITGREIIDDMKNYYKKIINNSCYVINE